MQRVEHWEGNMCIRPAWHYFQDNLVQHNTTSRREEVKSARPLWNTFLDELALYRRKSPGHPKNRRSGLHPAQLRWTWRLRLFSLASSQTASSLRIILESRSCMKLASDISTLSTVDRSIVEKIRQAVDSMGWFPVRTYSVRFMWTSHHSTVYQSCLSYFKTLKNSHNYT